ncbi:MAG: ATPase domain-containing protein [Planctomycetaceae bacterium]
MDESGGLNDPVPQPAARLISCGNEAMDFILGGGLTPYCFYLVEGDPGAGKTTFALQFALEGVRCGEKVLYLALSEGQSDLRDIAASHRWSLDQVVIADLQAVGEPLSDDSNTIFHPSEVELGELTRAITAEVEKHRPDRVVIDSLGELRHLSESELRYRRQLMSLKSYFSKQRCTVLLLDDRMENADLQLQAVSRGVIVLERFTPSYGRIRRRLQVVKMRGQQVRSGYHDFTIGIGGLKIFPRLVASEYSRDYDTTVLVSGLAEFDSLMGGGLERGSSTLLIGAAGSGKSSLSAFVAGAAIRNGEKAAVYVFDETAGNYLQRCDGLGIAARRYREEGSLILRQVDSAELSPGEFAWHVRQAVEDHHVSVVIIDSLNGYMNAMPDEQYLRGQLHELLSYLSQLGVTSMITLSQHGLVGEGVESPVETSYLADTIILLRYFEFSGRVRKAISVVKKRTGGHESAIRELAFSNQGIRIGGPLIEFKGILTGTPDYYGDSEPLFDDE